MQYPSLTWPYRDADEGRKHRSSLVLAHNLEVTGDPLNGLFFSPTLSTVAVRSLERGVGQLAADGMSPTRGR